MSFIIIGAQVFNSTRLLEHSSLTSGMLVNTVMWCKELLPN